MRYFIISFTAFKTIGDLSIPVNGNLTSQDEKYPNYDVMVSDIKEKEEDLENITILNIIEVNEQDFKDFTE